MSDVPFILLYMGVRKRYCPRGHDTDVVGRLSSGPCRECDRLRKRTEAYRAKRRQHELERRTAGWRPRKGFVVSYVMAHHMAGRDRGQCSCGRPARDWALDPSAPSDHLAVQTEGRFSGYVFDCLGCHYLAKCRECNLADGKPQLEGLSRSLRLLGQTSLALKQGRFTPEGGWVGESGHGTAPVLVANG
jgi:hypothetical protein